MSIIDYTDYSLTKREKAIIEEVEIEVEKFINKIADKYGLFYGDVTPEQGAVIKDFKVVLTEYIEQNK